MRLAKKLVLDHLRGIAGQGKTKAQAAQETGLAYSYICTLAKKNDIKFIRQKMAERPSLRLRAEDMRQRYENGETLEQIGIRYNRTRERVRQILTDRFGICARDGGQAEIARRGRRDRQKARDARSMRAWGCTHNQYLQILKYEGKPTYAYWAQRKNAINRGISWELNLWQWWSLWQQSGYWPERGRGRGYQMCRLNDVGPYSVDNIYIAKGDDNMRDYWVNRRAAALELAQ